MFKLDDHFYVYVRPVCWWGGVVYSSMLTIVLSFGRSKLRSSRKYRLASHNHFDCMAAEPLRDFLVFSHVMFSLSI